VLGLTSFAPVPVELKNDVSNLFFDCQMFLKRVRFQIFKKITQMATLSVLVVGFQAQKVE
jgi:hypothetical protein